MSQEDEFDFTVQATPLVDAARRAAGEHDDAVVACTMFKGALCLRDRVDTLARRHDKITAPVNAVADVARVTRELVDAARNGALINALDLATALQRAVTAVIESHRETWASIQRKTLVASRTFMCSDASLAGLLLGAAAIDETISLTRLQDVVGTMTSMKHMTKSACERELLVSLENEWRWFTAWAHPSGPFHKSTIIGPNVPIDSDDEVMDRIRAMATAASQLLSLSTTRPWISGHKNSMDGEDGEFVPMVSVSNDPVLVAIAAHAMKMGYVIEAAPKTLRVIYSRRWS